MIFPIILIVGGATALVLLAASDSDGPVPVHEPDLPPDAPPPPGMPRSTRYRKIDAILGGLKKAADASGIPLGLLVGWIARESAGTLGPAWPAQKPKPLKNEPDSERGFFQLTPSESARLGIDHRRLSTDPVYSIAAGIRLIELYAKTVDALNVAPKGSEYYWRLVKLAHTMGEHGMSTIVKAAQAEGQARTWDRLESYAVDRDKEFLSKTKHSPAKWFPLVDAVYDVGAPFGFGDASAVVVGGAASATPGTVFADIPDPLDCLPKV